MTPWAQRGHLFPLGGLRLQLCLGTRRFPALASGRPPEGEERARRMMASFGYLSC